MCTWDSVRINKRAVGVLGFPGPLPSTALLPDSYQHYGAASSMYMHECGSSVTTMSLHELLFVYCASHAIMRQYCTAVRPQIAIITVSCFFSAGCIIIPSRSLSLFRSLWSPLSFSSFLSFPLFLSLSTPLLYPSVSPSLPFPLPPPSLSLSPWFRFWNISLKLIDKCTAIV